MFTTCLRFPGRYLIFEKQQTRGFCCPYLHLRPFPLVAQVPCSAALGKLHRPLLSKHPRALGSVLAAERRGLKVSWRKGVCRWLSCGSTCGHPVFTSPFALWVSSLLVWLLKSYLPPAGPCTHPAFLGRSSVSRHTKEMLKLPLQLTEGERHFSMGAKMWLQLSVGFGKEPELFL